MPAYSTKRLTVRIVGEWVGIFLLLLSRLSFLPFPMVREHAAAGDRGRGGLIMAGPLGHWEEKKNA